MKTETLEIIALILIMLILGACGQSGGSSSEGQNGGSSSSSKSSGETFTTDGGSFYVTAKSDLKTCNDSVHRQLVYVEEEAKFYTCSSSKNEWVEVVIKGEKGDKGSDGTNGTNGTNGATGAKGDSASNQLVSLFTCGSYGDGSGVGVDHATATVYKNGYVLLEGFFYSSTSFRLETCGKLDNGNSISCNTTSYSSVPWQVVFEKSSGKMSYRNNGYTGRNTDYTANCTKVDF